MQYFKLLLRRGLLRFQLQTRSEARRNKAAVRAKNKQLMLSLRELDAFVAVISAVEIVG